MQVGCDSARGAHPGPFTIRNGLTSSSPQPPCCPQPIAGGLPVHLRVEVDQERLQFAYRVDGDAAWHWLPQVFDASILSDEATSPGQPNFTGAFVGMCCQDLAGTALPADFDSFEYRDREPHAAPFGPGD